MITIIVGIVGSPRKNGLTNRLIDAALEGARLANVETKKVFLIDFKVTPYVGVRESGPEDLPSFAKTPMLLS